MARKKKKVINLLQREDFVASTAGRVLAWILSTFRIIVIVTEILVMIAFLSRFWLDAQNTDLSEEVKQKQALLAASSPFEREFKDVQARLSVFNEYSAKEKSFAESLSELSARLPPDVLLTSVSFNPGGIAIKGEAASELSIQQYIVNLVASDFFNSINLGEISTSGESQLLQFNLNIIPSKT